MSISTIITILFIIYFLSKVFGKKPVKPGDTQYKRTPQPPVGDGYDSSGEDLQGQPNFEVKKSDDFDILAEIDRVFNPKPPEPVKVPGYRDISLEKDEITTKKTRIEEAQRLIPQTEAPSTTDVQLISLIDERAKQMEAILHRPSGRNEYALSLRKKLKSKASFKEAFILSEILGARKY